jgi:hypothetical protein
MNIKLIKRFHTVVLFLAMLALSAGNAFGVSNNSSVISPYWQTDADSYTFVAVSHPSLTGMNSEIGVILTALTEDRTTTFGSSAFTVGQNATTRVFIVATNHSTINSTNITGDDLIFITGTTNATQGSLIFTPRATTPTDDRVGGVTFSTGFNRSMMDATMLSYWGAVVVSSTNSGFAMEFIGDTHDSSFNRLTVTGFTALPVGLQ